jgi:hypothetical protein
MLKFRLFLQVFILITGEILFEIQRENLVVYIFTYGFYTKPLYLSTFYMKALLQTSRNQDLAKLVNYDIEDFWKKHTVAIPLPSSLGRHFGHN